MWSWRLTDKLGEVQSPTRLRESSDACAQAKWQKKERDGCVGRRGLTERVNAAPHNWDLWRRPLPQCAHIYLSFEHQTGSHRKALPRITDTR